MGTERPTFWTQLRDVIPIAFLSAAFAVGMFASQTQSKADKLSARIDNVQLTARAELDSAVQIRKVQLAEMERRIQLLEQIARENAETFRKFSEGQAAIAANLTYQSAAIDTMTKKLDAHMAQH